MYNAQLHRFVINFRSFHSELFNGKSIHFFSITYFFDFLGKAIICSQDELGISSKGYDCDSDTNSGSIQRSSNSKTYNSSCQQCMVERAASKLSSTNLTTLGIPSPESSFAESSISSNAMSPTQPNMMSSERTSMQIAQPPPPMLLKPNITKKTYIGGCPMPPTSKPIQPSLTLINANIIPQTNVSIHSSPRSIA